MSDRSDRLAIRARFQQADFDVASSVAAARARRSDSSRAGSSGDLSAGSDSLFDMGRDPSIDEWFFDTADLSEDGTSIDLDPTSGAFGMVTDNIVAVVIPRVEVTAPALRFRVALATSVGELFLRDTAGLAFVRIEMCRFRSARRDRDPVDYGCPMSVIPDSHADLLTKNVFWHIATMGPHDELQSSPVWGGWDGEHFMFSLTHGRQKYENLVKNPTIAMSGIDPENSYRYLEIRGTVVRIDDDASNAFIDSMAKKYMGVDAYPFHQPGDHRVVMVVQPSGSSSMG